MSFRRILVPLDGSPLAEEALPHAMRLARASAAIVTLLHVLPTRSSADPINADSADSVDWRMRRLEMLGYLRRVAVPLQKAGIGVEFHVSEGRPAEQILDFCRSREIDLIILGAYGWGGVSEFPFGSTVQKMLSVPGASQLVVRPGRGDTGDGRYRRILVPVDGSQRADWVVSMARELAQAQDAELVLLQVVQLPEMPRRIPATAAEDEQRKRWVEMSSSAARRYLEELAGRIGGGKARLELTVSGSVAAAIQETAEQTGSDLIVIGAHGAAGPGIFCGSVCRSVLLGCRQPVLVLQDPLDQSARLMAPPGASRPVRAANVG
jgi:nucleotide-binding universal stress UspA family protein